MASSTLILSEHNQQGESMAKRARRKRGHSAPDSPPTPATLSRREALSLAALLFVACAHQQALLGNSEDLAALAWDRIPEESRSAWYQAGEWRETADDADRRRAGKLRHEMATRFYCYPCNATSNGPVDPDTYAAKAKPHLPQNQIAAIIEIAHRLPAADLAGLFGVAQLLDSCPPSSEPAPEPAAPVREWTLKEKMELHRAVSASVAEKILGGAL